jgi:hypothetical protein
VNFPLTRRALPELPGAPTNLHATVDAFRVRLSWWPGESGGPLEGYVLEAGPTAGSTALSIPLSYELSYQSPPVPAGRYFVRVRAWNAAGLGPISPELEVLVDTEGSAPLQPPGRPGAWMSGRRLTLTWPTPADGGVPTGYVVEAGTVAGIRNLGAVSGTARAFTYESVPDGVFFLRVRATRGPRVGAPSPEVMLNVGGLPGPPASPTGVSAIVSGGTVILAWTAPIGPPPTHYVIEAGSSPGLADLAVFDTGNAVTTVTFPGIPPGRYVVRVRAGTALGLGVASAEALVVVGVVP